MSLPLRQALNLANCYATDPAQVFAAPEAGAVVHEAVRQA